MIINRCDCRIAFFLMLIFDKPAYGPPDGKRLPSTSEICNTRGIADAFHALKVFLNAPFCNFAGNSVDHSTTCTYREKR